MASPHQCHHLRTKKSYIPAFDDEDIYSDEQMNAQFFCLRTLLQTGADDGPVGADSCGAGRSCYQGLTLIS
ncbi:MAG: hypothetical protein HOH74_28355 [Gemmatimonadetes bacterium]|jgi:hypothetical protein|nr:hypothetical protein [Gemmatimonadota bacterium]